MPHHSRSLLLQATKNSAALLWLLVWMAGVSLSGMGLLASTLVRRAALATPLAFAIYILAWVFQLVISLGFPYSPGVSPGGRAGSGWGG